MSSGRKYSFWIRFGSWECWSYCCWAYAAPFGAEKKVCTSAVMGVTIFQGAVPIEQEKPGEKNNLIKKLVGLRERIASAYSTR